jgi:hypothetical protein
VRFISEAFFPLSCFNAVNSVAAVSAAEAVIHKARQDRHAINNIVFFISSPQDSPVESFPYKDSDERPGMDFYFAKNVIAASNFKQIYFR